MAAKGFYEKQKQLIATVKAKQCRDGVRARDVANVVGVAYSHWAALMSGGREFASMSPDSIRVLAKWLGVSVVQVRIWAGDILPTDFLVSGSQDLENFLEKIEADHEWSSLAPSASDWEATPRPCKFLMTFLYKEVKATTRGGCSFHPSGSFSAHVTP